VASARVHEESLKGLEKGLDFFPPGGAEGELDARQGGDEQVRAVRLEELEGAGDPWIVGGRGLAQRAKRTPRIKEARCLLRSSLQGRGEEIRRGLADRPPLRGL
jgi:hypothetical protein